ncbi:MAG TPA: branched-chain amino acid transaminase [Thermomicrobiales bacterium]|nr:branched-chain amino acid transaminase [Thermomicrobiales bacterium]
MTWERIIMSGYTFFDYAFFEGSIVPFADAKVSIATHSLQYGTGAFAGIRGYLSEDGTTINVLRLRDHTARLLRSAKLLRAELPYDPDSLATVITDLIVKNEPTEDIYIRPFIYKPDLALTPRLRGVGDELAVYVLPLGDYISTAGISAIVSSWIRVSDNAIPSRGKLTGSYVNSSFAKDEALSAGADEAILLNDAGKVAEGSAANLFMVRDGMLITPPINADVLEGITRRSIITMATDAGIPIEQRQIDRSELYVADELFLCGTGAKISPVTTIDGRPVGTGATGPVTLQLQGIFNGIVRATDPRYADWLTPVRIPVAATAD